MTSLCLIAMASLLCACVCSRECLFVKVCVCVGGQERMAGEMNETTDKIILILLLMSSRDDVCDDDGEDDSFQDSFAARLCAHGWTREYVFDFLCLSFRAKLILCSRAFIVSGDCLSDCLS